MNGYDAYKKAKDIYNKNEKFHTFVNRCCETYKYDLEFALTVKTIQDVGDYYANGTLPEGPVCINFKELEEDKSC